MSGKIKRDVWSNVVLIATILVYIVYLALAAYTLTHLPPIPALALTENGSILFTGNEVISGKELMQKYGLFDYGSFLGFGGYYGIDYTALALKIINDTVKSPSSSIRIEGEKYSSVTNLLQGEWILSNDYEQAYNKLYNALYNILYYNSSSYGLKPNLVNPSDLRNITAFIFWGALISLLGYTNGFPYIPNLTQPSVHVDISTWLMVAILLAVLMPMIGFVSLKILDHWRDPRTLISLPSPSSTQRLGLIGIFFAGIIAGVQGLLGLLAMHYYVEPHGLGLISFVPFNVARALHLNMAIIWVALTWVSFALFALPYLGVPLSRKLVITILGLTLFTGVGLLLGILLSYNQLIPSPFWFMFGSQGRPNDANQGTFWLVLVAIIFFVASRLFFKASKVTVESIRPLVRITAIGLLGAGIGAIFGALPIIAPWPHFTEDQYFLWIMIHSFVEGFWPSIVIPIVLILMVINNLIPPSLATIVASVDATSEIVSGMIGTAHHYYFGGQPVFWMYIGAASSMLEVVPIIFLVYYAFLLWRRGEVKTEFQKATLTFSFIAAIGGGGLGAIIGGGAVLNAPMINYFVHGLQFTMAHAHSAFPLVWGLTAMLMWVTGIYLSSGINDKELRTLRLMSLIYAIGFALQVISLWSLGASQLSNVLSIGYWAAKGTQFYLEPINIIIVWSRAAGDVVSGFAAGFMIIYTLKGVLKSLRIRI